FFLPTGQRFIYGHHAANIIHMAGKPRDLLAVQLIRDTNLELIEPTQHVEQHHRNRVHATQSRGIAHDHRVEPTATPRPPRNRAILIATIAQVLAGGVILLGRKRPAADACRIRLHDADDPIHVLAWHARSTRYSHA